MKTTMELTVGRIYSSCPDEIETLMLCVSKEREGGKLRMLPLSHLHTTFSVGADGTCGFCKPTFPWGVPTTEEIRKHIMKERETLS